MVWLTKNSYCPSFSILKLLNFPCQIPKDLHLFILAKFFFPLASSFPSIYSLMSSDHFKISFPKPDLKPRYDPWRVITPFHEGELPKTTKDTRQYFFRFSVFSYKDTEEDTSVRESRGIDFKDVDNDSISEKRDSGFFSFRPSRPVSFRQPSVSFNDIDQFRRPVGRHARQNSRGRGRAPVYPPFDPFNTTYIPLPGPSSPQYALRLEADNPHMFEKARFVKFRSKYFISPFKALNSTLF